MHTNSTVMGIILIQDLELYELVHRDQQNIPLVHDSEFLFCIDIEDAVCHYDLIAPILFEKNSHLSPIRLSCKGRWSTVADINPTVADINFVQTKHTYKRLAKTKNIYRKFEVKL